MKSTRWNLLQHGRSLPEVSFNTLRAKSYRGAMSYYGRYCEGRVIECTENKKPRRSGVKIGRRERIRTSDPLVPNQLRTKLRYSPKYCFLNF